MAIQGTQVPKYTKHTLFLYFSDFSFFFLFSYEKQNKAKLKKTNKHMLNKQSIKTRLTQNMKAKHISNAHTKTRRERKVIESLGALFFPHLERIFPSSKPLNRR